MSSNWEGGTLGHTASNMGFWIDGWVAPQGDTRTLGKDVLNADNAHSDNQRTQAEEALDITGWAQPQAPLPGPEVVCSENASLPATPISA